MGMLDPRPKASNFYYVHSCELSASVQIKICELEGAFRDVKSPTRKLGQLFVRATVYCKDRMVGYPVSTAFRPPPDNSSSRQRLIHAWNEWIVLPVKYCDLSRDSFVHLTVWEIDFTTEGGIATNPRYPQRLVAQSRLPLFSKRGVMRNGTIDVQVELSETPSPFTCPSDNWKFAKNSEDPSSIDYLLRMQKRQKYAEDEAQWLSRLTFPKIEILKDKHKTSLRCLFLVVEMATVRLGENIHDVIYYEAADSSSEMRLVNSVGGDGSASASRAGIDPELGLDNLCELKHTAMTRRARAGVDRELKPNTQTRARLESIMELPSSQPLTIEQRDLVWKFRYFLQSNRKALTKFVRSVNWDEQAEVQQALTLINDWAPIEAEDALELLSPHFLHPSVRCYAVSRLFDAASADQILLFLPQLVQALKYEPHHDAAFVHGNTPTPSGVSEDELTPLGQVAEVIEQPLETAPEPRTSEDLVSFLLKYAKVYPKMANFLYWHLKVEAEGTKATDEVVSRMYDRLRIRLLDALSKGAVNSAQHANSLRAQQAFVENLQRVTAESKAVAGKREYKEQILRTNLTNCHQLSDERLSGLKLPLDPSIIMKGIKPDSANLFNSAMMPVKLTVTTLEPKDETYTFIYKTGDDLRQDQLVIQMIRLMDSLMKKDQLDLRLTPYAVLATGVSEGFVQFVKARPLRDVLHTYGNIQDAMRNWRPSSDGPYKIEAEVLENYVRSLAGYSIVCYILGVGDRHLDNLLLCENGRLFHVDFGFFLGRDPKPMPPPMKLTTEMVQAMGGDKSKFWQDFRTHCDSAFQILRRNANVILNLFSLMLDAGIPDIAIERDKAVHKVEQRFRLDLTDEQAFQYINRLIDSSLSAKMPVLVDFVHDFRQNYL